MRTKIGFSFLLSKILLISYIKIELVGDIMNQIITLNYLQIGKSGKIIKLNNTGSIRRRLLDLGFIPGTIIKAELSSPFQDPIAYKIRNALVAIRKSDSKNIIVEELK